MKKIIFGVVVLFSIVGCSVNVRMNEEEQSFEGEESKVVVEENKIEQTEVLPSFSQDYIDQLGESTFVLPEKTLENGDKEYVFKPFGMGFTVSSEYLKYYPMDSIWSSFDEDNILIAFLTTDDFKSPPVGDGGEAIPTISKIDNYEDFKKNVEEWGGKDVGIVKIGNFDLQKFETETFGSKKIFSYVLKSGDTYYNFSVLDFKNEFMMEVIKSIKF